MNKRIIKLTENDLNVIAKAAIRRILKEDNDKNSRSFGSDGEVTFLTHDDGTIEVIFVAQGKYAKESVQSAYDTFITKLKPFIKTASQNGFEMKVSSPNYKDENALNVYIKIIDSDGNISSTISKSGYEYCATVIPIISKENGNSVNIPALVTMAPIF